MYQAAVEHGVARIRRQRNRHRLAVMTGYLSALKASPGARRFWPETYVLRRASSTRVMALNARALK